MPTRNPEIDAAGGSAMLDPLSLVLHAQGPTFVVLWSLIVASAAVWAILVIKHRQLRRWTAAEQLFRQEVERSPDPRVLDEACRRHPEAPSAPVVRALLELTPHRRSLATIEQGQLVEVRARLGTAMTTLSSIAAAAPFVGLFGTVWGILEAFLRIGRMQAATLPVVAPAIGEALVATALGLFAAIPAVIVYNSLSARLELLIERVRATCAACVDALGPAPSRPRSGDA